MKDKEIIEYLCGLDLSELNYFKGVVEGLIINECLESEQNKNTTTKGA